MSIDGDVVPEASKLSYASGASTPKAAGG